MSVTFRMDEGALRGYRAGHPCGATGTRVYPPTMDGYRAASSGEVMGCTDQWCDGFGLSVNEFDGPQVNVSNVHARLLLDALGLDEGDGDLAGSEDAAVFLGRVLLGLAVAPADAGTPAHEMPRGAGGGAVVVDFGREPGYLQDRLQALHEVAQLAAAAGRPVVWS